MNNKVKPAADDNEKYSNDININKYYYDNMNKHYYASLFIANIIMIFAIFIFPNDNKISMNSLFYISFHKHKMAVITSLLLSFGTSICLATDIIGDLLYSLRTNGLKFWQSNQITFSIDVFERSIILFYTVIANLVLYFNLDNDSIFSLFIYTHMLQHVGYICIVHCLCIKLRPDYFARNIIIIALVLMALLGYFFILACNDSNPFSVYYYINVVLVLSSYGILIFYYLNWIFHVIWKGRHQNYSVQDISLLIYISIAIIVLAFLPFICAILAFCSIRKIGIIEVLLFIYTNTIFNVLIGSTPSRILNYMFNLQKKNEVDNKKNLLRFMAHEVRSPLNVVSSGLKLLNFAEMSLENSFIINDIESECTAAVDLLNNLLEFEKVESNEINMRRDLVDYSFITNICQKCSILTKSKEIEFNIINNIDKEKRYYLYVDNYKIEQVIRNMITNAVKYSPERSKISVTIICIPSSRDSLKMLKGYTGNELVISIIDSGIGIPLEIQSQVFQQFKQFSTTSEGGVGLGLFISRKIVELQEGSLTFTSDGENMGSTFTLSLPLFDGNSVTITETNTDLINNEAKDDSFLLMNEVRKPLNVLIADDSTMNRKYLNKSLKKLISNEMNDLLHPTITEVDDGHGVLNFIKESSNKTKTHIIFMDNIMKKMNGPETCKMLRSFGYEGTIVGVSGNVLEEDKASYIDTGANFFLNKPVDTKQLLRIMKKVYHSIPSPENV